MATDKLRHSSRRLVAGKSLLLVLASVSLVGCVPLTVKQMVGPLALKIDATGVHLAVCDDVDATDLWAQTYTDETVFWEASGSTSLHAGTILTSPNLGEYFQSVATANQPELGTATTIEVALTNENDQSTTVVVTFELAFLVESQWLHPDNSVSLQPCPASQSLG